MGHKFNYHEYQVTNILGETVKTFPFEGHAWQWVNYTSNPSSYSVSLNPDFAWGSCDVCLSPFNEEGFCSCKHDRR